MVQVDSSKGGAVQVQIIGVSDAINNIRKLGQEIKTKVEVEMVRNAAWIAEEVQQSIMGNRAEIKSVLTGAFANSIVVDKKGDNEFEVHANNIPYDIFLEYGTSKMQARNHFRNTQARVMSIVQENIQKAVNEVIK